MGRRPVTSAPDARPKAQKVRDRRQQQLDTVVDAAARLFAANGFGHTGMAELCDAVRMGRGQLYNLIGSKENLLQLIHERFTSLLFEGAARVNTLRDPPSARLRSMVRNLMETIAAHQDYVWVFFNEWRVLGDTNRERYRRLRREYQDIFERILTEGVEAGEFNIADTHMTVLGILGMVNYSYQWIRPSGSLPPAAIADLFTDLVLDGIRTPPPRSAATFPSATIGGLAPESPSSPGDRSQPVSVSAPFVGDASQAPRAARPTSRRVDPAPRPPGP